MKTTDTFQARYDSSFAERKQSGMSGRDAFWITIAAIGVTVCGFLGLAAYAIAHALWYGPWPDDEFQIFPRVVFIEPEIPIVVMSLHRSIPQWGWDREMAHVELMLYFADTYFAFGFCVFVLFWSLLVIRWLGGRLNAVRKMFRLLSSLKIIILSMLMSVVPILYLVLSHTNKILRVCVDAERYPKYTAYLVKNYLYCSAFYSVMVLLFFLALCKLAKTGGRGAQEAPARS